MKILFFALCLFVSTYTVCQTLPQTFDLRNVNGINYVTPVKSQQGGTCWTHGAMAAMEGNLLMTGNWQNAGETGEPNLAEYHLDWWNGFNTHNNDDVSPVTGNGLTVHNGGDYRVTAAYLSRGEGAVRDTDAQSFNSAPLRTDPSYHYFYPRTIEWYTAGSQLERIQIIKQKIMDFGVLGTCMCVGYWNGNIHYQPVTTNSEPNHAVAIIGWNDTIQTPAKEPGAWLVKNSWGSNWGNGGYFWISYYDKHACQEPQMGAISFQDVEKMQYKKVYYHDYHGWRDQLDNCQEAFNAFTTSYYEQIEAISFYNAADSVFYEAIIYDTLINNDLTDTLCKKSGFIAHTGFHTISLDSVVKLKPNNDFYVYVKLSEGGHPYDKTSEVPVLLGGSSKTTVISKSSPHQSYYRIGNSVWMDLYNYDSTANFCIKALTNPLLPNKPETPKGDTIVCNQNQNSVYSIAAVDFSDTYSWNLVPANAGSIINNDTSIQIHWNSNFTGKAWLSVIAGNSNGFGFGSDQLLVEVVSLPTFSIGNDTLVDENQILNIKPDTVFNSYLWSDGSHLDSLIFNASIYGQGNHLVWLEVTDNNACSNRDSIMVKVVNSSYIFENELIKINILPNPTAGKMYLQIDSKMEEFVVLNITDLNGNLILRKSFTIEKGMNYYPIDISQVKSGVYELQLRSCSINFSRKISKIN